MFGGTKFIVIKTNLEFEENYYFQTRIKEEGVVLDSFSIGFSLGCYLRSVHQYIRAQGGCSSYFGVLDVLQVLPSPNMKKSSPKKLEVEKNIRRFKKQELEMSLGFLIYNFIVTLPPAPPPFIFR